MVSEHEKEYCKHIPLDETIKAYSIALNYPASFFLDPEPIESIDKETVSFRSLKSMRAAQEHAAIGAGQIGVMINDFFESQFNLPIAVVPDYRGVEPEVAAEALRQEWDIGSLSIGNMVHLLEKHGIRVFSLAENTQDVDAFSFWKGNTPYVFLNTQKSGERSRFDAAHELAHLVLHRHGVPQGKNAETEADRFAAALLMPKITILPYKGTNITIESILALKEKWKVSAMALIVQMKNVGVLSEWQYKTLIVTASKMGLRTKELNGIPRERSLILEKLVKALIAEGTSINKLAEQLHLPLDEVSALLFSVGIINTHATQVVKSNSHSHKPHLTLVK
ncbi:ImmA/IrrE family metallo-endopeptidase [Vibrio parahaemolyticus]|uniref:ImmA/IrrE family metallo-endopeptidase n=1 Tax=Vibrio parahaemolyticus TaxID=670 RepID=UPI001EEAF0C7|nr:ImmA/IrrE family metallo-endopeptidase [Vibrio parahaemolyticus]MCG6481417.1 ImmA/IrrE family metallo-endopeptidase [Vibrio parahaemolyticus]